MTFRPFKEGHEGHKGHEGQWRGNGHSSGDLEKDIPL